jgi:hypothetical protein
MPRVLRSALIFARRSAALALLAGPAGCHHYVAAESWRVHASDRLIVAARDGRPVRVKHVDGSEAVPEPWKRGAAWRTCAATPCGCVAWRSALQRAGPES